MDWDCLLGNANRLVCCRTISYACVCKEICVELAGGCGGKTVDLAQQK